VKLAPTLERLFWTAVSAGGASLATGPLFGVSVWQSAGLAAASAAVNFVTLVARKRLSILPDPGEGLPLIPWLVGIGAVDSTEELLTWQALVAAGLTIQAVGHAA
jgi:hypothetical protein